MIEGSTPAVAQETMRAIGVVPRFSASAMLISTATAAPSLMPEALPAVTVPVLEKAGRSFCSVSKLVSGRGYSSSLMMMSPLRVFTVTGAISSRKRPAFIASPAFCWLWAAK